MKNKPDSKMEIWGNKRCDDVFDCAVDSKGEARKNEVGIETKQSELYTTTTTQTPTSI